MSKISVTFRCRFFRLITVHHGNYILAPLMLKRLQRCRSHACLVCLTDSYSLNFNATPKAPVIDGVGSLGNSRLQFNIWRVRCTFQTYIVFSYLSILFIFSRPPFIHHHYYLSRFCLCVSATPCTLLKVA